MIKGLETCLFSYLSQFKIVDKNGVKIGHVGDAIMKKDSLEIDSFIISGSFLEEKLEDLHIKEDIDPIVPLNIIDKVDPSKTTLTISQAKDNLKTTSKDWKVPEGFYKFSKLKKVPIFDKNNEKIGQIVDIYYQGGVGYFLIVGGSWLEEFLESIKIFADKDLIVPQGSVESLSLSEIKLKTTKINLRNTLAQNVDPGILIKENRAGFVSRGGMSTQMNQ